MNDMVKGAGAPAQPVPRPVTLFNTLITVPGKQLVWPRVKSAGLDDVDHEVCTHRLALIS
jgi:hypothetical protein